MKDIISLEPEDVLTFDFAAGKPLDLLINGKLKFRGQVVSTGRKKAFSIHQAYRALD